MSKRNSGSTVAARSKRGGGVGGCVAAPPWGVASAGNALADNGRRALKRNASLGKRF